MSVIICAINCGLIIHIYLFIIYYFHLIHFSLFFLSLFSLSSLFSFCCRSGTHSVVTLLWTVKCVINHFIHYSILFLFCCLISLGSTGRLICDTAFGMQHTKFLGGMCNLAIFGWSSVWCLGHLESPIAPVTYLVLVINYSYLNLFKI